MAFSSGSNKINQLMSAGDSWEWQCFHKCLSLVVGGVGGNAANVLHWHVCKDLILFARSWAFWPVSITHHCPPLLASLFQCIAISFQMFLLSVSFIVWWPVLSITLPMMMLQHSVCAMLCYTLLVGVCESGGWAEWQLVFLWLKLLKCSCCLCCIHV